MKIECKFCSLLVCIASLFVSLSVSAQNTDIWNATYNAAPATTCRIPMQCALGTRVQSSSLADIFLGVTPTTRILSCTAPLTCGGGASHDLSSDFTVAISGGSATQVVHGNGAVGQVATADIVNNAVTDVLLANAYSGTGSCDGTGLVSVLNRNASPTCVAVSDSMLANAYSGVGSCTSQVVTGLTRNTAPTCTTLNLIGTMFQNQGTTTTLLHGNGAGTLSWAGVADNELLNAYSGVGSCTNQVPTTFNRNAAPTCTSLTSAFLPSTVKGWTYTSPNISLTTSTDKVGIGTASPLVPLEVSANAAVLPTPPTGTLLQLGNADAVVTRFALYGHGAGTQPQIDLFRANGTAASPTLLTGANGIGSINFWGYDGSVFATGAALQCQTNGAWSTSSHGTNCLLLLTPDTLSTAPTEQFRIDSTGHIAVKHGTSPTVTCTGTGTSPTAPTIAGVDPAFTITMSTGTGTPGNTGTCTVTFATAYTAVPVMVCMLVDGATAWSNEAVVRLSTASASAPVLTWTNEATGVLTGLTVSTTYKISCTVMGLS